MPPPNHGSGGESAATRVIIADTSLERVQSALEGMGCTRGRAAPEDEPKIIGTCYGRFTI